MHSLIGARQGSVPEHGEGLGRTVSLTDSWWGGLLAQKRKPWPFMSGLRFIPLLDSWTLLCWPVFSIAVGTVRSEGWCSK